MAIITKRNVTPGDALNEWINSKLKTLWVIQPGIIQSFNAKEQTATVLPAFQRAVGDGEFADQVPIGGVQVFQFGGANGQVCTAPMPDDPCLILWSQFGLERWRTNKQATAPRPEGRVFQRQDAIALVGFTPFDPTANNIQITPQAVQVTGKLSVGDIEDVEAAIKALQTTT